MRCTVSSSSPRLRSSARNGRSGRTAPCPIRGRDMRGEDRATVSLVERSAHGLHSGQADLPEASASSRVQKKTFWDRPNGDMNGMSSAKRQPG